ncbi:MAG: hypothetical protein HY560_10910 [Gemmatimonadetes bacterium]|nr:hypothetical protein [Gemmatimonadota bacterium]
MSFLAVRRPIPLLVGLSTVVLAACVRDAGPPRELVRLQAFSCSERGRVNCDSLPRGAPIPRDSLPPVEEAFQVWAWHSGQGKVVYRVEWRSPFFAGDSTAPLAEKASESFFEAAGDSSMLTYNFAQAARTRYVLRVLLENRRGKVLDQDSLIWDFSGAASPSGASHIH